MTWSTPALTSLCGVTARHRSPTSCAGRGRRCRNCSPSSAGAELCYQVAGLCGEGPGPTTAWLPLHTGPQRRLSEYGVGQTRDSSVCHRRDANQAGGGAAPRRHSASGLADSLRGFTDGKRFSSSKILKSKFQSLENGESRNYELTTRRSLNKCKSIRHQPLKATRS